MNLLPTLTDKLLAVVALACVAVGIYQWGAQSGRAQVQAKWDKVELDRERAAARERAQQAAEMKEAREYQSTLIGRLVEAELGLADLTREKEDAIRKLATGRPCLGADLVRVLNDDRRSGVPQAGDASSRQPPVGAAAEEAATDSDVARWAAEVKQMYEVCAGRYEAWQALYRENKLCR